MRYWSCKFSPQASTEYISFLNDGLPNDYYLRPVDSGPRVTNGAAPPLSPRSDGSYIISHTITSPRTKLYYLAQFTLPRTQLCVTSHTITLPRTQLFVTSQKIKFPRTQLYITSHKITLPRTQLRGLTKECWTAYILRGTKNCLTAPRNVWPHTEVFDRARSPMAAQRIVVTPELHSRAQSHVAEHRMAWPQPELHDRVLYCMTADVMAWPQPELHGRALYCMTAHRMAWPQPELHGHALYCMTAHSMAWPQPELHGRSLNCMTAHSMAWPQPELHGRALYCRTAHTIAAWPQPELHGHALYCITAHSMAWPQPELHGRALYCMTAHTWPPCLLTLFILVVFRDKAVDFAHEPLPPIPGSESADHDREPDERDRAPDERDRALDERDRAPDDKGTARFSSVSVENESGIGLDDSAGESGKLVPGSDEQRAKVNRKNNVVVGQPISPSKNSLEPRYSHGSHERMETAVWSGLRVEPGFPTFRRIQIDLELLLRKRVDKNNSNRLRLVINNFCLAGRGVGWIRLDVVSQMPELPFCSWDQHRNGCWLVELTGNYLHTDQRVPNMENGLQTYHDKYMGVPPAPDVRPCQMQDWDSFKIRRFSRVDFTFFFFFFTFLFILVRYHIIRIY